MKPIPAGLLNSLTFRPALPADAPAISAVYLAARKTFLPYAPLAHSDDDVRGWIRDHLLPICTVTVAVSGAEVVGFMALLKDSPASWIDQLYLLPGHTGQGTGAALLQQAKATLGAPIRLYTFQENTGARRFYERHGFQAIAFGDGRGNEEGQPDVLYEWRED